MNGLGAEVDFATNEAMFPKRIHLEAVGQEADAALVIGAADEDDLGGSANRQPIWRPVEARRCSLLTLLGFEVMGGDEAVGTEAQLGAVGVAKAFPDLGLPEVVEGLALVLEAMLAGRSEDGRDSQGQAEEGDGTEAIGMVMRPVKAQIVVERSVGGQAVRTPVGQQRILGELGGDGGVEETAAKAAVQGDGVEDLDFADRLNDAPLDNIKGVQLGPGRRDIGQVPARRGRGPTPATGALDEALALEDVGQGGPTGQWLVGRRLGAQGAEDGDRAVFPQDVAVAESVAPADDAFDDLSREGVWRLLGTVRTVQEIDPVESASARSRDPVLDVGEGETKLTSDLPQGDATPREQHQLPPMGGRKFFMRCRLPGASRSASFVSAPLRSASTPLAERPWTFVITHDST